MVCEGRVGVVCEGRVGIEHNTHNVINSEKRNNFFTKQLLVRGHRTTILSANVHKSPLYDRTHLWWVLVSFPGSSVCVLRMRLGFFHFQNVMTTLSSNMKY